MMLEPLLWLYYFSWLKASHKRAGDRQRRHATGKVVARLPGKGDSNSRGARLVYQNHLDDEMDSDQEVVN